MPSARTNPNELRVKIRLMHSHTPPAAAIKIMKFFHDFEMGIV